MTKCWRNGGIFAIGRHQSPHTLTQRKREEEKKAFGTFYFLHFSLPFSFYCNFFIFMIFIINYYYYLLSIPTIVDDIIMQSVMMGVMRQLDLSPDPFFPLACWGLLVPCLLAC